MKSAQISKKNTNDKQCNEFGKRPHFYRPGSQDISNMDDKKGKRELFRGVHKEMAYNINTQLKNTTKPRFNVYNYASDSIDHNPSEQNKSKRNHYWLESLIYFTIKISVMVSFFIVVNPGIEQMANYFSIFVISSIVILQLLSNVRLSQNDITPIRKKRMNFEQFAESEVKFVLLLCTLLYLIDFRIEPLMIFAFIFSNFIAQSALFYVWRLYNNFRRLKFDVTGVNNQAAKNIIIVGASERGKKAADIFMKNSDLNAKVIGFVDFRPGKLWRYRDIPLLGHADSLAEIVASRQVDYVVMATEPGDYLYSREIFDLVEKMGIDICVLPDIYDYDRAKVRSSSIDGHSVLMYCSTKKCKCYNIGKVLMDKVGAIVGLLLASPILIVSAIAIKIDSKGPIFFKQKRSGKNGKLFNMLKLRTMTNGADKQKEKLMHLNEMSGPVFKIKNDPRITKIGKILRKYSIDEFPQFINILKGDMSLVGPRPPVPSEVAQYEDWQRRRLAVKPGATCLWQINGRNNVDFDKWIKLDLKYIDNWSLKEDTRIILKTFPAIMRGNGAS